MAIEIERKFLLKNDSWRAGATGEVYCQGYCRNDSATIRVRIAGEMAFLTIKGQTQGCSRREFEYVIPVPDAEELLELICAKPYIRKTRYLVPHDGRTWEIDVFDGDNAGLIVAEIELSDENETFELPPWIGHEVTGDQRYYNSSLAINPFKNWK